MLPHNDIMSRSNSFKVTITVLCLFLTCVIFMKQELSTSKLGAVCNMFVGNQIPQFVDSAERTRPEALTLNTLSDNTRVQSANVAATLKTVKPVNCSGSSTLSIIVLTMNRHASLRRLLESIERTDYGSDCVTLVIKVDHSKDNQKVVDLAQGFTFTHGVKVVDVAKAKKGLRQAWFDAWTPLSDLDRAVIVEDDLEMSPHWYKWLMAAWRAYGNRTDLNGISLNRQAMVPKKGLGNINKEIVNDHKPFLFAMIGSHGFSPEPRRWVEFLAWIKSIDVDRFDVSVPGLITTDWFKALDKSTLWTQYFIYFCKSRGIFTLHVNLPNREALVSHWAEPGVHNPGGTPRRNFAPASSVALDFPAELVKYGFGAEKLS